MEQPKTDVEYARQALRVMSAALEKAKQNHGDLYTFGDCASVYAAMMKMNEFIEKHDSPPPQPNVNVPQPAPQPLQINQPFQRTTVNYSRN